MSEILEEYALQIAEGYVSFVMMYDPYEDVMTAEAYAKARINNDIDRIVAEVVDAVEFMEVS